MRLGIYLDYVGPHNNLGFVPPESVTINGEPIEQLLKQRSYLNVINKATIWAAHLGERIFNFRGSSDCDVVESLLLTLWHVLNEDVAKSSLTLSHYLPEHDVFCASSGIVSWDKGFLDTTKQLNKQSNMRLLNAIRNQKIINKVIHEAFSLYK